MWRSSPVATLKIENQPPEDLISYLFSIFKILSKFQFVYKTYFHLFQRSRSTEVSRPTLANHIAAGPVDGNYQVVVRGEAVDGGQGEGLAKPDDAANRDHRSIREGLCFFHCLNYNRFSDYCKVYFHLFSPSAALAPDRIAPPSLFRRQGVKPRHVRFPRNALRVSAVEGVVAGDVVVNGVKRRVVWIVYCVFHYLR